MNSLIFVLSLSHFLLFMPGVEKSFTFLVKNMTNQLIILSPTASQKIKISDVLNSTHYWLTCWRNGQCRTNPKVIHYKTVATISSWFFDFYRRFWVRNLCNMSVNHINERLSLYNHLSWSSSCTFKKPAVFRVLWSRP